MPQAVQPPQRNIGLFASDGEYHVAQDTLLAITLAVGAIALVLAQWRGLHVPATWAGLIGIVTGAWGQMISVTTRERFLILLGLGASGLGFFLAMARGGFSL
ncbi:membrane protein [Streptomyces sp. CNQ-509]|uniref:hypothetical protein n=1 Tax=unclassified Streptomyces TaxID=2593676 RepID=UPI00062DEB0F|nr:hypothetical protein [Streptomyces sp. CNQ-509]AKH83475.1 membrane protein [Streptomyces sp. CNQ-509]